MEDSNVVKLSESRGVISGWCSLCIWDSHNLTLAAISVGGRYFGQHGTVLPVSHFATSTPYNDRMA